jgi:hypothetical protein
MPLSNPVDTSALSAASHAATTLASDADTLLGLTGQQITLDAQNANTVLAGPATGAAADPTYRSLVAADLPTATRTRTINFLMDGGGVALTTGEKGVVVLDFPGTLQAWTLLADPAGALQVDVRRTAYADYPAAAADSLCNGHAPEIAATGAKAQDTDLSDWADVTLDAGDALVFYIASVATIERATLALKVQV